MHKYGGRDQLSVDEVPDPEPGPGEVRIKVDVCALNHVDVDIREGISRFEISLPHLLGLEVVGRVDTLGPGAEGFEAGDRVMPYLLGGDRFIGVSGPGGFADYVVAPTKQLVSVPEAISDEQAGALQVAFGTAWHMLFGRGGLRIGETVLINSVSSGIGSAAVQLAHLAGAMVIGTSSSPEKLEHARSNGLDIGIDYTTEDVAGRVMEVTGGRGVDLVFEHVGGELFQKAIESLARTGGWSPAAPTAARWSPSTSSPSSAASTRSSARSSTTATSSRRCWTSRPAGCCGHWWRKRSRSPTPGPRSSCSRVVTSLGRSCCGRKRMTLPTHASWRTP